MSQIKVWPHMTIVAVAVALIAGLAVAFYFKHEQTVQAEALPNAARIQRIDGEVAFQDALNPGVDSSQSLSNQQWVAASANQPFSDGDRIYTRENAHASLAFTGRNFARLNPNTNLDVIELSDNRTQLALRDGSAIFDVGDLATGQLFEVGTPYGAVDFAQPGLYNVGFDNNGNVLVSVLSGLAQVVGLGGSGQIGKGEMLTLLAQTASQVALSRLNGNDAGYLVDDYYRYQYPNVYDGRYSNYDAYLNDPYYYDPYRRNVSYQYAPALIPGLNDLDYYGDWQNVSGYGYAWRPRVDSTWAPYQEGYWVNDYPYGPTWVASEPWGYAPYHYGRWANVGSQWYWVPDSVNTTPRYAPALVAFVPLNDQIGWVPLGPGDPYVYRYYDQNWQPHYLSSGDVAVSQLVNLAIPNAVTVIPVDAFGRPVDRRSIRQFDRQMLGSVRPTLEPLLDTPLRNAALRSAWGRGKIDIPPGIAKKLDGRQIFVANTPGSPFGKRLAKDLRVEPVPDRGRKEKFRDDRGVPPASSGKPDDVARKQEIDRLTREAAKGNRDAERQARQLEQEQRKAQNEQERAARKAAQEPQGQRVGNPAKPQPQPRVERPQPRAERPQAQPRAERPQPQPRPQAQAPQMRQEPKAQSQAAPKQERKQGPPSNPGGQGGGKGKGKKP